MPNVRRTNEPNLLLQSQSMHNAPKLNEFGMPNDWRSEPVYWCLGIIVAMGLGGITGGSVLLAYADFDRFWLLPVIAFALVVVGPLLTDLRFQLRVRVALVGAIAFVLTPASIAVYFEFISLPFVRDLFNNKGVGPIGLLLFAGAIWVVLLYLLIGGSQPQTDNDEP